MNYSCLFLLGKKKCKLIINFFSPNTSARITSVTCHNEYRNAQISVVCVYKACFPINSDLLTGYRYINVFFFFLYKTILNCGRRAYQRLFATSAKTVVCAENKSQKLIVRQNDCLGFWFGKIDNNVCVFVTAVQTTGGRLGRRLDYCAVAIE